MKIYRKTKMKNPGFKYYSFMILLLFICSNLYAQKSERDTLNPQKKYRVRVYDKYEDPLEILFSKWDYKKDSIRKTKKKYSVSGILTGRNRPLKGVRLRVLYYGIAYTDSNGYFSFDTPLREDDIMEVSLAGFKTQHITIKNENSASSIVLVPGKSIVYKTIRIE